MSIELGRFGLWTSYSALGQENAGVAAALAERLGYGTLWLGGSPRPSAVTPLLVATERLAVATGIVNVWSDPAELVGAETAQLVAEHPGRFMLGIGIGHPEATSDYTRPLATMREFLDGLDAARPELSAQDRCLAALGPKMLDLSRERSAGTHPYFTPPDHTRFARERLGTNALLAPELACVVDSDPARGRATARRYAAMYLGLQNYTNNLLRFGFTEQDIVDGGSDRLIDTIVPHGSAEQIAAAAQEHLDAGADHVCLQTVGVSAVPKREWTALATALGLSAR
ncbi:MAG: LLM class F420-dependent oxidoreductase [Actinomycetota bacterium]|nr:LLM class F420-dependent oxidoreductase [Actinomycetota bacterium]